MVNKLQREENLRKLRINIKSLAAEARFNRLEKHRASHGSIKQQLDLHRTGPLRQEARVSQLAYAFLRDVPYRVVENSVRDNYSLEYVCKLVAKKLQRITGCETDAEVLRQWFKARQETVAA
jgi:hypothetical protein